MLIDTCIHMIYWYIGISTFRFTVAIGTSPLCDVSCFEGIIRSTFDQLGCLFLENDLNGNKLNGRYNDYTNLLYKGRVFLTTHFLDKLAP